MAFLIVPLALGLYYAAQIAAQESTQAAWAQTRPMADSTSVKRERLLLYERSFRPSTYDAPLPALTPADRDTSAGGRIGTVRDFYAAPETVQGFRIQVLNTNNYDESISTRNALLAAIDTWWVYVIFDSPTYKVRIGDFATRLEAKSALEQIQMKGFPNAWLVPDKVVLHLPARMPLAAPLTDSSLIGN
ncbi:MAG TPA: SPOR domain-containing protein [Bacteroidota bacterium]|nr:SPOR domain-containing protein [Bacteroidota bacterium]